MVLFSKEDKFVKVILRSHLLLPVINRFGIHLGVGELTIEEVCNKYGVNIPFFLAIVNTFQQKDYFPREEFLSFPATYIVEYLKKTHKYYREYKLPKIEQLMSVMMKCQDEECQDFKLIRQFYSQYKNEVLAHIGEEDEQVFPYVIAIQNAFDSNTPMPELFKHRKIQDYEKEHGNVDDKLNDLKNLMIKYVQPHYDDNECNEFLTALYQLEKDLIDHARIEDKILVPLVQEMEKKVHHVD